MLNLLLNPKSIIPVIAILIALGGLSYGWYWHSQYGKSQAANAQLIQQLATCNANQELLQSAVQRWKAAAAQQEQQLKRKEALVAKMDAESKNNISTIQQTPFSPDCDTAIKQGLELISDSKVGFHWDNNIP